MGVGNVSACGIWVDVVSAPTHSGAGEARGWVQGAGWVSGMCLYVEFGWMWFQHPHILVQVRHMVGCGGLGGCW